MFLVFDASVLILFHRNGQLRFLNSLLNRLESQALLLSTVETELLSVPLEELLKELDVHRYIFNPSESFLPHLGRGERAVIQYTYEKESGEQKDVIPVVDDLAARKAANKLGLSVVGSVGLCSRAFELCLVPDKDSLKQMWDNWRQNGFHLPKQDYLDSLVSELRKK